MKAIDTLKIAILLVACSLLVTTTWAVMAIRDDMKAVRETDAADAQRAREVLSSFVELSDNYEYLRLEWINRQPNSSLIARESKEWRVLAKAYRLTKPGAEMISKLNALRAEYKDLTWKHPTWTFMIGYTPDVKALTLED